MKKLLNITFYIIIIIVSFINIIYGVLFEVKEYRFLKESETVTAHIYQTVNREDGKQVLYFTYRINGKKYEDLLVLDKHKTNKSYIKIYYDKNNPLKFTDGCINKKGYIFIALGSLFLIISFILILKDVLKRRKENYV